MNTEVCKQGESDEESRKEPFAKDCLVTIVHEQVSTPLGEIVLVMILLVVVPIVPIPHASGETTFQHSRIDLRQPLW
jgi:hypothetical protein